MKNQVCIEVKAKTQLRLFDENKRRKVRYIKEGDAREVCFLLASSTGAAWGLYWYSRAYGQW